MGEREAPLNAVGFLNVLLVGGVLVWTFHENARRALAPPAFPPVAPKSPSRRFSSMVSDIGSHLSRG